MDSAHKVALTFIHFHSAQPTTFDCGLRIVDCGVVVTPDFLYSLLRLDIGTW